MTPLPLAAFKHRSSLSLSLIEPLTSLRAAEQSSFPTQQQQQQQALQTVAQTLANACPPPNQLPGDRS